MSKRQMPAPPSLMGILAAAGGKAGAAGGGGAAVKTLREKAALMAKRRGLQGVELRLQAPAPGF